MHTIVKILITIKLLFFEVVYGMIALESSQLSKVQKNTELMARSAAMPCNIKQFIYELARMNYVDRALAIIRTEVAPKEAINGEMLLSHAAALGNQEAVTCLLGVADKDRSSIYGETPLYSAAHSGHEDVVIELLRADADKNGVTCAGETPLYGALKGCNFGVVRKLLLAKVDKEKADNQGLTPLGRAVLDKNHAMMKLLLTAGANKDMTSPWTGRTLLSIAAEKGDIEAVKLLLIAGARVNVPDNKGLTPLYYALCKDYNEIAHLLIVAGAGKHELISNKRVSLLQIEAVNQGSSASCGYHALRNGLFLADFAQLRSSEVLKKMNSVEEMQERFHKWSSQIRRMRFARTNASELTKLIMTYYNSYQVQGPWSDLLIKEKVASVIGSVLVREMNRMRDNNTYSLTNDVIVEAYREYLRVNAKQNSGESRELDEFLLNKNDLPFEHFSLQILISNEGELIIDGQRQHVPTDWLDSGEIASLFEAQKRPELYCLFYASVLSEVERERFAELRNHLQRNEDVTALIMICTSTLDMPLRSITDGHWFALVVHNSQGRRDYLVADSLSQVRTTDPRVSCLIRFLEGESVSFDWLNSRVRCQP